MQAVKKQSPLTLAVCQMNAVVGDITLNAKRIVDFSLQAKKNGADVMITPEMSICGYPAEDLWFDSTFITACDRALKDIATRSALPVLVGYPRREDGLLYNAISLVFDGKIITTYCKQCLPNDSVFDENRYFVDADQPCVVNIAGVSVGLLICEDLWVVNPLQEAISSGAEVVVVVNASPYSHIKNELRQVMAHSANQPLQTSILYVNTVGGQDELVFDGGSFAVNPIKSQDININNCPSPTWQMPRFEEALGYIAWTKHQGFQSDVRYPSCEENVILSDYQALRMGLGDYLRKNNIPKVWIGLSGGIDSAVTLAICVEEIGTKNVHAVMMPSPYTSSISLEDARGLAKNLGVALMEIPIDSSYQAITAQLAPAFDGKPADITEENIQARIRGIMLMALANKFGGIVVNTSNKSEMATGYGTLYGDMVGGFALLKDVLKRDVYMLAEYINRNGEIIPQRIINRAPSAELRHNQTDQDSLPPYKWLDLILEHHLEYEVNLSDMLDNAENYGGEAIIHQVFQLLHKSEYKRRQSAIGVRLSEKAFGKDRRMPITHKLVNI